MRRRWRNCATSLVGHLFSTLVVKFQFWSLSPPIYNTSTCPVLGSGELMGWGRSQWVCFPWQPLACAQACSSLLLWWGREKMLNSACKQLTCSTALQLCISSDAAQACTQGWDFLLSQHPRRCLGCGGFFIIISEFFHFLFHCFIANLCKYFTSPPFTMDCGCCRVIWLSIKARNTKLLSSLLIEITLWCLLHSYSRPPPFISV